MINPVNFHFQTKLPESLSAAFYRELHFRNLERIYLFLWVPAIIFTLLLVVDYLRFQSIALPRPPIYTLLLWIHLSAAIYFALAIFIKLNEKRFYLRQNTPKYLVYGILTLFALTGPPQDILTFHEQGTMTMYFALILLTNWALNLPHRVRIVVNIVSFTLMTATILYVGRQTAVELTINLYEVIGFTLGSFIFGTIDYNLRVRKFWAEKQLEQEKKKIEELEKFKSSFYMNLTHEFRTPLTVIMGMTGLGRAYAKEGDQPALAEAFNAIDRNSSSLLQLINQMLDLARLESKSMELHLEQKDIVAFARSLVASLQSYGQRENIDLQMQSEAASFYLDFDEEKMRTILMNLLSNALKFTPEDGAVALHIAVEDNREGERLVLRVEDTGYGIAKEHLPYIFDRFYQAETGPTRKTTGTGIGLALTRELVQLMDGTVDVESELGRGTVFTLRFPVHRMAPRSELKLSSMERPDHDIAEIARREVKKGRAEKPLLLLVEDNMEVLNYLTALLENDYVIEIARDGLEGTNKAIDLIPDVIISDVMMPHKDGFALCRDLKQDERTNHIPIIILTARADMEGRLEGLGTGADAYLAKPFKKEELFIRLEKLIELRARLREKFSRFALIENPEALQKEDRFIHRINTLLEENLANFAFSVEDMARGVFMSRMQLHRKLKAVSDRSASNYLRSYRLHRARPLLKDQAKTIGDVAYDVGFQDPNYFSKAFHREFGMTPSEFRNG